MRPKTARTGVSSRPAAGAPRRSRLAAGPAVRAAPRRAGGSARPLHERRPGDLRAGRGPPGLPSAFRRDVVSRTSLIAAGTADESPDPLTPREIAIPAYLPTRLSNPEIAAREFVSLNTMKTHIARIYRKLDTQSRATAVDRAAEPGLLVPPRPSDP